MLNINGDDWRIVLVSANHPVLQRPDGGWTIGACVDDNKTIYIQDHLSTLKMKKVLCHEITHAAMFSYHVLLSLEQEELLADLIATYGEEIINVTNKIFSRIKQYYTGT